MEFFILATTQSEAPWWIQLIPLFLVLFIFYLLLFRPLKKEKEEHKKLLENLKKNDKVLTQGGIYGVVSNIQGNEVTLKVDEGNNVRIRFAKSSIVGIFPKGGEGEKEKEKDSASTKEEEDSSDDNGSKSKKGKKGKKGKK